MTTRLTRTRREEANVKKKNDTALTYTYGLIEFIGRRVHRRRGEVVERLGSRAIERVYQCADVLCADSIDRVADEYVAIAGIEPGDDDNVGTCHYEVPGHWVIMQVFERLILDVDDGQLIDTLHEVYAS